MSSCGWLASSVLTCILCIALLCKDHIWDQDCTCLLTLASMNLLTLVKTLFAHVEDTGNRNPMFTHKDAGNRDPISTI